MVDTTNHQPSSRSGNTVSASDKIDALQAAFSTIYMPRRAVVFGGAALFLFLVFAADLAPLWGIAGYICVLALSLFQGQASAQKVKAANDAKAREFDERSAQHSLFAMVEALPQPAFLLDLSGRVLAQNGAAQSLTSPVSPLAHISSVLRAPEVLQSVEAAARSGEATTVAYLERVPVSRWLEAHVVGVDHETATGIGPLDDQSRRWVLLLLRDLTQERRLEKMRADFVANASHELRTPLASVLGFIETLEGPARDDVEARLKFLRIMREQASRMARLIGDLMSLSRIEAASHIVPTDNVDLGPLLGHVRDSLAVVAEQSGVNVTLSLPENRDLTVRGNADELTQVFQNLIENAIRYGETGGEVQVTADRKSVSGTTDLIFVTVQDFGPGIPSEHLPRLTERFYRVDVESSRKKGGTGLGLAIVKHILNRHRAEMRIESKLGEGANFTVMFGAETVSNTP